MKRYDFRETDVYLGETPEGSFVRYDDATVEINAAFHKGAQAMFDRIQYRAANHWHADPEKDAQCSAENALVLGWVQDAFEDISPEGAGEWVAITKLNKENAALKAEIAALKEWRYSDQDLAIKILSYLGFSQEPSKEPYADRRRDRIAEMICLHCESLRQELAAMKAPPKTLKAEEVTEAGYYWWRGEYKEWEPVRVDIDEFGVDVWRIMTEIPAYDGEWGKPYGEFIGPLKATEVTNT